MRDCPDDCVVWMTPEEAIEELMLEFHLTMEEATLYLAEFIALNPLHIVLHNETMH